MSGLGRGVGLGSGGSGLGRCLAWAGGLAWVGGCLAWAGGCLAWAGGCLAWAGGSGLGGWGLHSKVWTVAHMNAAGF